MVSLGAQAAKVEWLSKAIGMVILITAVGIFAAPKLMAYARNRRVGQTERFKAVQPVLTVFQVRSWGFVWPSPLLALARWAV